MKPRSQTGGANLPANQPFRHFRMAGRIGLLGCWLFACLFVWLPSLSYAAQQEFNQIQQGEQVLLSYVWQDPQQHTHYLKFSLPRSALNEASQSFRRFSPHYLTREIAVQLQKLIYSKYPSVAIQLFPSKDQLRYQLRSQDSQQLQLAQREAQQVMRQAQADSLNRNHLMQITDPFGRQVLIPDHNYFMQAAIPQLQPAARAISNQQTSDNKAEVIQWLLSYVQSIPYAALGERGESDFIPPLSVLRTNRGDCDSKAVLLASLLRILYPELPLAMIYLPEHAVLGIQLNEPHPVAPVSLAGQHWLLAEAAGPAMLPLGEVSASTQAKLDRQITQVVQLR